MKTIKTLREVQKEAIEQALTHTNGDLAQASLVLGIGQKALKRLVREHGLDRREGAGKKQSNPEQE